ncbi:MAG: ABC transporter ATP-binding protein [Actinobacteria bacterium]|nr:ABC transporter ATP-binding protein [Actinomycetota bacterium]
MSEREPSGDGRPAADAGDARGEAPILELRNVSTSYGPVRVLDNVTMEVRAGEVVCLLGSNAAGKTTTLRTILGLVRPSKGEVVFSGERIDGLSTPDIVAKGITMVPENRRLFGRMSVRENLEIGAHMREDKEAIQRDVDRVLTLFPRLKERLGQKAGTLSGGEQQMLAIGRALTANPRVLLMDEPSMGLAPILVEQVFSTIKEINEQGTTIFVVEQNANMALSIADRGYVLQTGQIVLSDSAKALLEDPRTREAYLGELT